MVFKFTKTVPDGYTEWFTIMVSSSMAASVAKVSASFDPHSVQLVLDRAASERQPELAAAADPHAHTIYYTIGVPTDQRHGSSMPVTAHFKTRTR